MEALELESRKIISLKKEYLLKKERIASRLREFDLFWQKPHSWHFENNSMVLKLSSKSHDETIFEELCFCIFTANTSAEMGMKAIDAVRDLLASGAAEEMTKKLEGVYRFNNLRPAYIKHTRDYLQNEFNFELKKKIESLKNDKEALRDFFAFNKGIKGLAYKEASHFLRNIGIKGYAILDKHVLNCLHEFNVIEEPIRPSTRERYREMERKMIIFSNQIGIPMDELDLLFWSRKNGKIMK